MAKESLDRCVIPAVPNAAEAPLYAAFLDVELHLKRRVFAAAVAVE
jgi:hypothetical protein